MDNGADESLISAKLAECLVMKDSNINITTILGESDRKNRIKTCAGYIRNKGKIDLFALGNIDKHTPKLINQNIIAKHYGLEEERFSEFSGKLMKLLWLISMKEK